MDHYGEASPTAILTLLEEAAADHCLSINHSLFALVHQGIGWVLLSGYMQMERYPLYKEKITIRTWLSKYSNIKAIRENIIYDEQRGVIGRAKGLWLFFDIRRRKPVRICDDIQEKWSCFPEESIAHDISEKIGAIESATHKRSFFVHRFDMDTNKHVNNVKYLQWLLETVPDDIADNFYLYSIDGRYTREAQFGHRIESIAEHEKSVHSFIHTIRDLDSNHVCSTARTVWRKRV